MTRVITPEGRERLREAGRRGGKTRAKAFTPDYQRAVASCKSDEAIRRAAKAGYQATASKHGHDFARRKAADYRRANPSGLERQVADFLNAIGVAFLREAEVQVGDRLFFVDFDVAGRFIEGNGAAWHDRDDLVPGAIARTQSRADQLRDAGFDVLHVSEAAIADGSAWLTIERWLHGEAATRKKDGQS